METHEALAEQRRRMGAENDELRAELERVRSVAAKTLRILESGLRSIVEQDAVELALDPQWSQRVARITLTEAGL